MVTKPSVFSFTAAHGVSPLGPTEAARQESVATMIKGWNPEGIFFGGDNVWPEVNESTSAVAWDYWRDEISDQKVWPAMGVIEHQGGYPVKELDTFPYLPEPKLYYKVVFPLVTFFVIDTERFVNVSGNPLGVEKISDQMRWLYGEIDGSFSKWNVVVQYGAGWTSSPEFVPGSEDHQWTSNHPKVDVVLCGQGGAYERFAISGRPPIINVGIGGVGQRGVSPAATPGSVVRSDDKYGAIRILVTDNEMDLSAIRSTGDVPLIFDRLTLTKDANTTDRVRSVPPTK